MAEIFGLVTGAVQALAAVDRAVQIFGRLQNAPKQIRLVRILLGQIDHDLAVLKQSYDEGADAVHNHRPEGRQIPHATISEIEESLDVCRVFVDKYYDVFSDKASRGRIFWSSVKHTAKLEEIRARIADIYPLIIMPLTMRLLLERIPGPGHRHEKRPVPLVLEQPAHQGAGPNMVRSPCDMCGQGAAPLNGIQTPIPEDSQREEEAQQVEDKLNEALTINLRDVLETGRVEVDADLKNLRGTTLTLQGDDVPPEYRTLFLTSLQLATRDELTTMLRFNCTDPSIRVQHLVQFSTLPSLTSITSPDVLFRATHPITLLREDGNLLLHVAQPYYHFTDVSTRQKFQELVRSRKFLGEMVAVEVFPLFSGGSDSATGGIERCSTGGTTSTLTSQTTITSSSSRSSSSTALSWKSIISKKTTTRHQKRKEEEQCLARMEPLQIWELPGGGATMTFVADGEQLVKKRPGARGVPRDQWRVQEWHAVDFAVPLRVVAGERSSAPWAVEMWWAIRCVGTAPGVRVTFRTRSEAKQFAKLFKPPDWGAEGEVLGAAGNDQLEPRYLTLLDLVGGLGSIESEMLEVMGTERTTLGNGATRNASALLRYQAV